jgi:hypothetical protein
MSATLARKKILNFTSRLQAAVDYHRELLIAVQGKRRQAALETMLCEQFAFNVVVLWEVFLSDMLLQYLVASPKRYKKALSERIFQSVKDRFGAAAGDMLEIDIPGQLSLTKARSLVDPKQFNITFHSADSLSRRANDLLSANYARLFTLNSDEAQFVDFVIAFRNYLAHRSKSAHGVLKQAITGLNGANAHLQASTSNFGTYLKTRDAAGDTTSILLANRLIVLANMLK